MYGNERVPDPGMQKAKAYIPLQRETTLVGASRWVRPPMRAIRLADTNMLVSEKHRRPLTQHEPQHEPNVSRWNIWDVLGKRGLGLHCLSVFFRVGYANSTQREGSLQWNMDLSFFKRKSNNYKTLLDPRVVVIFHPSH